MIYLIRCVPNLKKIYFHKNDEMIIIEFVFALLTILYYRKYKNLEICKFASHIIL